MLAAVLAFAGVAALIGLAMLWPKGEAPEPAPGFRESQSMAAQSFPGTVSRVTTGVCGSPDAGTAFDGDPRPAPPMPQVPGLPGGPAAPVPPVAPAPAVPPAGSGPPAPVVAPVVTPVALTILAAPAPPAPPAAAPAAPGLQQRECRLVIVDIAGGPDQGRRTLLEMSDQPGEPELAEGTKIHLTSHAIGAGQTRYAFLDINRTVPVWAWMVLTALAIMVVAAWRGVRAIAGLVLTLAVVGVFLIPALLRGGPPVALSLITGAVVLFPVMFLVHGVNWKSAAALGGTLTSLAAAAGLAHLAIGGADLRGLADESNLLIQLYLPAVSVTGLMLAGFIVGALGVLNDVTIAQSSTVTELSEADPDAGPMELFTSAMRVGRDHISSMVYTLVLAYVGASLPMTLLLSVADRPLMQVLTSDIVATELLRSAIGALGLTLAVPVTTAIAAVTTVSGRPQPQTRTQPPARPSSRYDDDAGYDDHDYDDHEFDDDGYDDHDYDDDYDGDYRGDRGYDDDFAYDDDSGYDDGTGYDDDPGYLDESGYDDGPEYADEPRYAPTARFDAQPRRDTPRRDAQPRHDAAPRRDAQPRHDAQPRREAQPLRETRSRYGPRPQYDATARPRPQSPAAERKSPPSSPGDSGPSSPAGYVRFP